MKSDYIGEKTRIDFPLLAGIIEEEPSDESDNNGLFGTATDFIDPRCRLLDMLTPDKKKDILGYFVWLLLDKYSKGISHKTLKTCLRKDSARLGAAEMTPDVRSIGRFLGSRTLQEVTWHRCGNDECLYAWIGAVHQSQFEAKDSPDCCTLRYTRKSGALVPKQFFYYFCAF
jgi:hypothetical protein